MPREDQRFEDDNPLEVPKLAAKDYMDAYINPEEYLDAQRKKMEQKRPERKTPERPERDVLKFLLDHAPLERWERDVLEVVRAEAYYFVPQKQTKIMNEGWASYWHSRMMTEKVLNASEIIDYADNAVHFTGSGLHRTTGLIARHARVAGSRSSGRMPAASVFCSSK